MKQNLLFCCGAFLLLAGCATPPYIPPPSAAHYQQQLAPWTGKNVADVSEKWGVAASTEVMSDGSKRITWNSTPHWGCSTIGVANSSGTILSWDFQGGNCMTGYSDEEIQKIRHQLDTLSTMAPRLKRGTHLRLSFYPGAVDSASHRVEGDLDCYFLTFSRFYGELTVRPTPEPKHGLNINQDRSTYELRYISQIAILSP